MIKAKITVAKYLEQQLAVCGKSQREIAAEIGYANANIVTMFKTGVTKIPLTKVGPLAKALNVDPAWMLRMVMHEYMRDTWDAIEGILGKDNLVTEQDKAIAMLVREVAGDLPIDLSDAENRKLLSNAIRSVVQRDQAKAKASVERLSALPANARKRRSGGDWK
jgi:antitoxin component of RelBE/YafQ-DinJ toxin-antitoxin module